VYNFPGLFARIDELYQKRASLGLGSEQIRLLERQHLDFVRAGARFDEATRVRYSEVMEKLAALTTQFTQNVLADESDFVIRLTKADLVGCPDGMVFVNSLFS
jgi:peptidyl-dipeptidase Dcp